MAIPGTLAQQAQTTLSETYLTERQFSDRYHVAPRTLQRWRVTGEGPRFVRLGVRRIAYRLSDAEAWAGQHVYVSRADELYRLAAA
ncbi:MAG TPA: DNA-binding protein [Burkholderiaceae bacterium]